MDTFQSKLHDHHLTCSDQQLEQFELYYRLLVEWNQKMNLTTIVDRSNVYIKHFFDSVSLAFYLPMAEVDTLADIGSGAGFPSLPLKILYPHLRVTIIDSLAKRIRFLEELVAQLKLDHVDLVHGRAEDISRDTRYRDAFDVVTARAVAKLPVLNEICLPFVRIDGHFIAMKGSDYESELKDAEKSMRLLKSELKSIHLFHLPDAEGSTRAQIIMRKTDLTPKMYPRKAGVPVKSPLV